MKRKITVRLSEHIAERLDLAAKHPGASKTAIMEAALDRHLGAEVCDRVGSWGDADPTLVSGLDAVNRRLEVLHRDLGIVNETVALHARYHLTITPLLSAAEQHSACTQGAARFDTFAAQVASRIRHGTPLMRETIDRLNSAHPDLVANPVSDEVAPLNAQSLDPETGLPNSSAMKKESSAAAGEGGSHGGFPGDSARFR